MFISSFWSKPLIWVPVSFLSLLVPYSFSFISLFIGFIFPSNLWPYSTNSVSILITSVLNCASHRLAITLLLSCIFSGALICSFIWAIFLCVCRWACYIVRGRALGVHQGRATQVAVLWHCRWGRGPRGNSATCSTLPVFSHFPCCPQANWALLVLIPRWVVLCTF